MRALAGLLMLASAALSTPAQVAPEAAAAEHAKAAQDAERRNDFPTAVAEYRQVAKLFPRSAEVQSNLGVALYFNHELPGAISTLRRAIDLNPELLAPHLFSGLAWYRLSNPDAAVPELSAATRIDPSDVLSHTWLGYAYVAQSRYDLALKELRAANQLQSDNIDVLFALGQTLLAIGTNATTRLVAVAPDGARVWQLAGEQAELRGDRETALADYEGALKRRPDLPEVRDSVAKLGGNVAPASQSSQSSNAQEDEWYGRARDAEQQAREMFERVAQIAPDSYRAHQTMGDSLTAEERFEDANTEYRAALLQKPDLPGVHEVIGSNLLRTGKLAGALAEFNAEIALQPRSASAHTHAAQALLLTGNDEEARRMLASAQAMDRPPAYSYRLLGKLDLRAKNYQAAVKSLTHYVSIRSDDASAYYLLSKAYAGMGDREHMRIALASFERLSRDAKERSRAQTELAGSKNRSQDADEKEDLSSGPGL